jgi:serine/threonine protein kinase
MSHSKNPRPVTTFDSVIRLAAEVAPADFGKVITVGAVLGDGYELRERIGTGGMAVVYRAYDRRLHREVAVKVPKLAQRDRVRMIEMFEREARATACLCHPNIVTLHHIGDHDGTPFVVLELLSGETLAERLARRRVLGLPEASAIVEGVLRALSYAHDRGFVHRDLSPRNVFLTHDERIKLLDFGVAVDCEATPGTVTRSAGTPGYMAPEHQAAPDPRGDLWAASVLFVECLTGQRPGPRVVADDLPAELAAPARAVVARALDPDPDRRPGTASELSAGICGAPALPRSALVPLTRIHQPRWRRALPWLAAAALLASGVLVAGVVEPSLSLLPDSSASAAAIAPREGRWRGDPAADTPWTTTLRRLDATHFLYGNHNQLTGRATEGVLTLERIPDGTTLLSGKIKDVLNCPSCTKVGFIELIVLDETHLYQNRSAWGYSHENYVEWYPPYRYKWLGPVRQAATP